MMEIRTLEVRSGLYIIHIKDNDVDFLSFIPAEDSLEKVFADIAKEREKGGDING